MDRLAQLRALPNPTPDELIRTLTERLVVALRLLDQRDADVREAYGRGRDDEAAGLDIPEEFR